MLPSIIISASVKHSLFFIKISIFQAFLLHQYLALENSTLLNAVLLPLQNVGVLLDVVQEHFETGFVGGIFKASEFLFQIDFENGRHHRLGELIHYP